MEKGQNQRGKAPSTSDVTFLTLSSTLSDGSETGGQRALSPTTFEDGGGGEERERE